VTAQVPTPIPTGDSYDALIKKANGLAESGNCTKAIELYQKAFELKSSAEALTGQAYCHIDAKQFSSAFSKFRTALVISPRYEPALRGVAEGYLQQGLKERAIEAYKAYLDAYPDSAVAKKQLDRLGGGAPAPAPAPAPPADNPAPPPAAPDPGAGAGSG
jgi:tetratricopeptide (TPR) repeat protein